MLKLLIWILGIILGILVLSNVLPQNCWDKYPNNETQAIQQCEEHTK